MKVNVATAGKPHQRQWGAWLADGLARHGCQVERIEAGAPARSDIVACWGWRVGCAYREAGHDVLVAERGYLGDRFRWTGLGWNGLNGRAAFPLVEDGARFARHFEALLQPERAPAPGLPALIVGQVPGDMSIKDVDIDGWYREMTRDWAPAVFRPHPVAVERGAGRAPEGVPVLGGTLAEAFAQVRRVVTFNSNTGVEALLAGMAVEAYDEGAMVWPWWRAGPTRETLLRRLAWCQWTPEEIADGSALEAVLAADRTARWCDQRQAAGPAGGNVEVAARCL